MKFKPKKGEIFAHPEKPRCVVELFRKYINSLKEVPGTEFYKKPLQGMKFSSQNIGINTLDVYMRRMFVEAGIDITGRKITGHSGKRTMMSTLYNNGFKEHMVKMKSGNRSSESVRLYQVPDINKRKKASDVLSTLGQ